MPRNPPSERSLAANSASSGNALLPWRGSPLSADRPGLIAFPPRRADAFSHGRMLKWWRYVGIYGPQFSLCVASVRVGLLGQEFWAFWDRESGELTERTRSVRGKVKLTPGRVRVLDKNFQLDLTLDEVPGTESFWPDGPSFVRTRKQLGVGAHGTLEVGGNTRPINGLAVVDDTLGYHGRKTFWRWSAGFGTDTHGRAVGWNLVEGPHVPTQASEQAVWIDGSEFEPSPVTISDDLRSARFETGEELRCEIEAERAHAYKRVVVSSSYRQPFGKFSGTLPGGIELADGYGVMEEHDVAW